MASVLGAAAFGAVLGLTLWGADAVRPWVYHHLPFGLRLVIGLAVIGACIGMVLAAWTEVLKLDQDKSDA